MAFRRMPDSRRRAAAEMLRAQNKANTAETAQGVRDTSSVIGSILGTAVGTFMGNPLAGAAIGAQAGKAIGDIGGAVVEENPAQAAVAATQVPGIIQGAYGEEEDNPLRDVRNNMKKNVVNDKGNKVIF